MADHIVVEMMSSEFIVWRCLHSELLATSNVNSPAWEQFHERNESFLVKMIEIYGSCAVVAKDADHVVARLLKEAAERRIEPEAAKIRHTVRLDLV